MPGKKGASGRPPGSSSWWRNPTARAGHYLNALIERWLVGAPISVGSGRWLSQPTERRYTVPPKIKRVLAEIAIQHVMDLQQQTERVLPEIEETMQRAQAAAKTRLTQRGWTDAQIAAWKKRTDAQVAAWGRKPRKFSRPDLQAVLDWSRRFPPELTLRRQRRVCF